MYGIRTVPSHNQAEGQDRKREQKKKKKGQKKANSAPCPLMHTASPTVKTLVPFLHPARPTFRAGKSAASTQNCRNVSLPFSPSSASDPLLTLCFGNVGSEIETSLWPFWGRLGLLFPNNIEFLVRTMYNGSSANRSPAFHRSQVFLV